MFQLPTVKSRVHRQSETSEEEEFSYHCCHHISGNDDPKTNRILPSTSSKEGTKRWRIMLVPPTGRNDTKSKVCVACR